MDAKKRFGSSTLVVLIMSLCVGVTFSIVVWHSLPGRTTFIEAPPVAGEVWEWRSESQTASTRYGPWPRREFEQGNLILDVRDGWVRFNSCFLYNGQTTAQNDYCNGYGADRRMPLSEFMLQYRREIPSQQTLEPGVTYCKSSDGSVRQLQKDEVCR